MKRIAYLHSSIGHTAKVYDNSAYDEYVVKFYSPEREHYSHADYYTDSSEDALNTARAQLTAYKQQD